jgi:cytochrome c oxidase subunit 2
MSPGAIGISGRIVENVFLYIAVISVSLLILITFLMVYFVIRYQRKRHPQPVQVVGKTWLEILWTVVPTFLVLTMFYYGYTGFKTLKKVPEGAFKIKVTSRQWSWLFEYPNGIKAEELKVPVGKPIDLRLTSQDVIHSFYLPAFKIKQDAVPGFETRLWFEPKEVGTFDVLCAEYCGQRHSYMLTKVTVLSEKEFTQWYKEGEIEAKAPPRGAQLFQEKGCKACHSTDGSPLVGPTVKGLFGKKVTVVTEGREQTVLADEGYLKKSILEPGADVVKGFPPLMPPLKMTEQELNAIIKYIEELK